MKKIYGRHIYESRLKGVLLRSAWGRVFIPRHAPGCYSTIKTRRVHHTSYEIYVTCECKKAEFGDDGWG